MVNQLINVAEGEIQDICVSADCNSQPCERTIPVSLLLSFDCTTCGTYAHYC